MPNKTINITYEASAPTRIDLAGGTLDIWPIYVLENGGLTINVAINRRARARLKIRPDSKILIESKDINAKIEFANISRISHEKISIVTRIVQYFCPNFGFELETETGLPLGTGLAASSSLGIALMHLFNALTERGLDEKQIIYILSNIEAQTIGVNSGKQDYYPATYGGFNAIRFECDGDYNEKIPLSDTFLRKLNDSFVLCFTGRSHFSATNNWTMLKRYIENDGATRASMAKIKHIASKMYEALKNEDFDAFANLIEEEGHIRVGLAEDVLTPQMIRIIDKAKKSGAIASKPLGAGGGGYMLFVCEGGVKPSIIKAIEQIGAKNLNFEFEDKGVSISVIN